MKVHFTDSYLLNPQHKVTVNLIGLGGTGSQVLTRLACLNEGLISLGHPGIHVYAYDGDIVSSANIGRQLFSSADIGINKAIVLISRVNRYFGYEWEAVAANFIHKDRTANITITCVDSAAARLDIAPLLSSTAKAYQPLKRPIYWLDFGNLQKTGQAILGTIKEVKQPVKSSYECAVTLPTVIKKFPELKKIKEKMQGPSCSLAEAITKQDLNINPALAVLGCDILWKLFHEAMITYHGLYLNLATMTVNPIKII